MSFPENGIAAAYWGRVLRTLWYCHVIAPHRHRNCRCAVVQTGEEHPATDGTSENYRPPLAKEARELLDSAYSRVGHWYCQGKGSALKEWNSVLSDLSRQKQAFLELYNCCTYSGIAVHLSLKVLH